MLAAHVIVLPTGAVASTRTTIVNTAEAPGSTWPVHDAMMPVSPTAGVCLVHPSGVVSESNVVASGVLRFRPTFVAATGPLLTTVTVNVRSPPWAAGWGVAATAIGGSD